MTTPQPTACVDVVEPGRAIILFAGRQARVSRDGRRFWIEDVDTEEHVGYATTYRDAGKVFALYCGIANALIEVDHES